MTVQPRPAPFDQPLRELAHCQPYYFEMSIPLRFTPGSDLPDACGPTIHKFQMQITPDEREYLQEQLDRCIKANDKAAMWLFPATTINDLIMAMEPIGLLPMRASFPTGALLFNIPVMLSPWVDKAVIVTQDCLDEVQHEVPE